MTNHYHLGGRRFAAISHYRQLVLEGIHSPNPWEGLKNRDAAMFHAYCSGGYKQREIAHYCGAHYTTVSRAIKRIEAR